MEVNLFCCMYMYVQIYLLQAQSSIAKKMTAMLFYPIFAKPTRPIKRKESYILATSNYVLTTLCMLSLRFFNFSVRVYERCLGFRSRRIMGKYTCRHLFSFSLLIVINHHYLLPEIFLAIEL